MKKEKTKLLLDQDVGIYFGIIFILIIILSYYNWRMAIMGAIVVACLFYYHWETNRRRKAEWEKYVADLVITADTASKKTVVNLPLGIVIIDLDGSIKWYNPMLEKIFNKHDLMGENITEKIPQIQRQDLLKKEKNRFDDIKIADRVFYIEKRFFKGNREHRDYHIVLYFHDVTELRKIQQDYNREKLVIAHIQVDNLEEVLQDAEEENRPVIIAEVEKKLRDWAAEVEGSLTRVSEDRFVLSFYKAQFDEVEKNRFEILDKIKEINVGNPMSLTLSIGVGVNGKNPVELSTYAQRALDLALGRGGDQAVVKDGQDIFFYGGKSRAIERRTKVKARVMAHAIRELMEDSDKILVVSHDYPDMDSIGAAVGLMKMAGLVNRQAFFVVEDINKSAISLIEYLREDVNYKDTIISPEEALKQLTKATLLVVVDTHRPSFVTSRELLEKSSRVVVVDHHRRGEEFIQDPMLVYLEPYASSTCELVTEVLQYFQDDIKLSELEATAMMAGIVMDTKNFSFKTGVRTFEAASFLRRSGADPTFIHELFQEDKELILSRAKVVENSRILYDNIAVSIVKDVQEDPSLTAALGADTLLKIRGVSAAFVICPGKRAVVISGRSLGKINVQVILEKLGGGGHLTVAGAQLKGATPKGAFDELKAAIEEYLEEGDEK